MNPLASPSANPLGNGDARPAASLADAAAARRPRSAFWRAVERVAAACTRGELGALADHHQVGQPALAARFRAAAAAFAVQGRRA